VSKDGISMSTYTNIISTSYLTAHVAERRPLYREVRGSNPSHDTMALLFGRYYEFPQCGIIKVKLILLLIIIIIICPCTRRQV
jgi:hypothetical protein